MLRENWRWLAAYAACALATVLLLADLGSSAMWVLVGVVAAVVAGVVVVTGRKERARPIGRVVVSFEADTTAFIAAMERAATAADVVVPQQRQGGTS